MADTPFVIREYRGKRVQETVPLAWADEATPPGFLAGYYPGSALVLAFSIGFSTTLQALPELNVYPETPTALTAQEYPSWLNPIRHRQHQDRVHLTGLELNEYPATPAILTAQGYPAYLSPATHTWQIDRIHLAPLEIDEYPGILLSAEDYPAFKFVESFRTDFTVALQTLPELDRYAPSPAFLSGFYPAPVLVKGMRTAFTTKLLTPQELNTYPLAPSIAPFTAYLAPQKFTSNFYGHRLLQVPEIDEYPGIPPVTITFTLTTASFAMVTEDLTVQFSWTAILKGADESYSSLSKGASESYSDISKGSDESYTDIDKGEEP